MADSTIGSLPEVERIQTDDLFVLEQNGEAMKLSGELLSSFIDRQITTITVLERAATEPYSSSYNADTGALTIGIPRGVGIASISDPTVTNTLYKTYTITYDKPDSASAATTKTFTVKDGNYITGITAVDDSHTHGGMDHYRVNFVEGNPFDFYIYNGNDGYGTPGTSLPLMDGTAAVGEANMYSRQDHVHPSDTSRQPLNLYFTSPTVGNWDDDPESLFDEYPVRGEIACTGVRSTMFPEVVFDIEESLSGSFAPVAKSGTDVVYIYADGEPTETVKVLSVAVFQ